MQTRDQAIHFAVAFLVAVLFIACGVWGGLVAGFAVGLVREVSESGTPVRWINIKRQLTQTDAPLDLLFWSIGGGFAAIVLRVI